MMKADKSNNKKKQFKAIPKETRKLLINNPTLQKFCQDVKRVQCYYCRQDNALSACSQCRYIYYCNRDCQTRDWKHHKEHCHEMKEKINRYAGNCVVAKDFEKLYDQHSEKACSICFQIMDKPSKEFECHHRFCLNCTSGRFTFGVLLLDCPLCSTADWNMFLNLHGTSHAPDFLERALFAPEGSFKQHLIQTAHRALDRLKRNLEEAKLEKNINIDLLQDLSNQTDFLATQAQILVAEKRYEVALLFIDSVWEFFEHPVDKPELSAQDELRLRAVFEMEKKKGHMRESFEDFFQLGDDIPLCMVVRQKVEALLQLGRFEEALTAAKSITKFPEREEVEFQILLIRCHYHLKQYVEVLCTASSVFCKYRYPPIYEYVAWSFDALGLREEAIAVLRWGVRHAQPWNPEVKMKYERLMRDLMNEVNSSSSSITTEADKAI